MTEFVPEPNFFEIPPEGLNIVPGPNGSVMKGGNTQSANFNKGISGWQLDAFGNLEANDGNFRGDITGASGTFSGTITATTGFIGGWTVNATSLTDTAGVVGMSSAVTGGDDIRFWAGDVTPGSAEFRVTESGALFASSATITGAITATSGAIGGWSVNSTSIYTGTEDHAAYTANAGDMTIYSTGTDASIHAFNWYIDTAGDFHARDGDITGVEISGIPNTTVTDLSLMDMSHNLVFSVTDADTVAWASGTINMSNGRTFSISGGNTGNMSALTYIYLDPAVSSTVLQTTTTYSTATGNNKRLLGTAQNHTVTAHFIPYGPGQPLIDGANIGALSIVAGNIAATTITAGKMSVSQLSAITADLGTITAGTVTGATIRTSASNPKFQMTSVAFQGFETSGNVVFEIVIDGADAGDVIMGDDATGNYAKWDDSAGTFTIFGTGASADVQTFTSSDDWEKPARGTIAFIQCWGGGGGGGGGSTAGTVTCGGGGGGGYTEKWVLLSALGATETVTIGAGGTAGSGGVGGVGGNTTFGSHVTAYGGGGGSGGTANDDHGGGGGGGVLGVGLVGTTTAGGAGGKPDGGVTDAQAGGFGGGAGAAPDTMLAGFSGNGGGGGGGGSANNQSDLGGNSYYGGGGGGGGTNLGTNSGGTSINGGAGGVGGSADQAGTAGTQPGGGGGGAIRASGTKNGGVGGAGKVVVTTV